MCKIRVSEANFCNGGNPAVMSYFCTVLHMHMNHMLGPPVTTIVSYMVTEVTTRHVIDTGILGNFLCCTIDGNVG